MEFNHIYSRYVFKDSNNISKHCTTTDYNITQNLKRILCGGSEAMSTSDAIMAEEEREATKKLLSNENTQEGCLIDAKPPKNIKHLIPKEEISILK